MTLLPGDRVRHKAFHNLTGEVVQGSNTRPGLTCVRWDDAKYVLIHTETDRLEKIEETKS